MLLLPATALVYYLVCLIATCRAQSGCAVCTCSSNSGGYGGTYTNCGTGGSSYGPFRCYHPATTGNVLTFLGHGNCPTRPSTLCAITTGFTTNSAGVDCRCGYADCTSSTGMFCVATSNTCSFRPKTCAITNGTISNTPGVDCKCGTTDCTLDTGLYCAVERNTCLPSALPGPPQSVAVRVYDDDTLQVTIAPPLNDGGANITHYEGSLMGAYQGGAVGVLQSFPKIGCQDLEFFNIGTKYFLAVANYRSDTSKFRAHGHNLEVTCSMVCSLLY